MRRNHLRRSVDLNIDVDLSDIIDALDDCQRSEVARALGIVSAAIDLDVFERIEQHLLRGEVHHAIAICTSEQVRRAVSDAAREAQLHTYREVH